MTLSLSLGICYDNQLDTKKIRKIQAFMNICFITKIMAM